MSHLIQKWPKNKANFLRPGKAAVRPAFERGEATPPQRKTKPNRVAGFARSEPACPVAPLTGQALSEAGETPALPS